MKNHSPNLTYSLGIGLLLLFLRYWIVVANVKNWIMKEVTSIHEGEVTHKETYDGEQVMSAEGVGKYLRQTICSDSTNALNIEALRNKGVDIQNKIVTIIINLSAAKFHFEVKVILRNSHLISSILSTSEVWYSVTIEEMKRLEQVDEMCWFNILEFSGSVPRELLHLELGLLRIQDIIRTRRLMFLHLIMHQPKSSFLYRFFLAQARSPTHRDWTSQVIEDLEFISLDIEINTISEMSKERYKSMVTKLVKEHAFIELIKKKT